MSEWISVKDRLPDKQAEYLCCYKFSLNGDRVFIGCLFWYKYDTIPHWQGSGTGLKSNGGTKTQI